MTVEQVGEESAQRAQVLFLPGEGDSKWFVLHTRPRCEKKAVQACADLGIRHYLPLRKSAPRPRKGQRHYQFEVPLFPGYAFACLHPGQRLQLFRSGQLVRTIEVVDQAQLLGELQQIYLAINGGAELVFYPQLKRGRRVRIKRGALKGVVGLISQRKEQFRLVLNVTILGQAVAVEVDMEDVELVQ